MNVHRVTRSLLCSAHAHPLSLVIAGIFATAACRQRNESPTKSTAVLATAAGSAAAPASATAFYAEPFQKKPTVAAMTDLGRRLFFDAALSASGKMSCATCHDPAYAYGPADERSVKLGGPDLNRAGMRAVPSLRYLQTVPAFSEHHFEEAVDESADQGPTGGHGWDGRADTVHDQARLPLTSPFEMANDNLDAVVEKVERASYAAQFREAFGDDLFEDRRRAAAAVLLSLEVFQQSPRDFYPYSSRYDAWLRQRLELTAGEKRGLAIFEDPKRGNCASCHPSQIRGGAFPQFTDFGFVALGVPRNHDIPANQDPSFHDLGLCGPLRKDLSGHREYCGAFRAPTLRNVALRHVFFHNGVFHRLEDVLEFYSERDTRPSKWYSKAPDGGVDAFDDLPPEYRANVNREPPFDRKLGAPPVLTRAEIRDLVAFLQALTDEDAMAARRDVEPSRSRPGRPSDGESR
jgi:cytochrome c peroxidase